MSSSRRKGGKLFWKIIFLGGGYLFGNDHDKDGVETGRIYEKVLF